MNVLFLDDDSWRWVEFSKHFPDAIWCYTASQAIDMLTDRTFDLVCLDHDLALPDQSGMRVVEHLVRLGRPIEHVWIHSWNSPAASAMHLALYRAGIVRNLFREMFSPDAAQMVRRRFA